MTRRPPRSTLFPCRTPFPPAPAPASLAGSYGTYTFNPTTGAWSYTLNQALADPLTAGQIVQSDVHSPDLDAPDPLDSHLPLTNTTHHTPPPTPHTHPYPLPS